jgi:endonuclease G
MADTAPGSSGSPVFNDQWEVVALHHASVRTPASDAVPGGFVNEGVRVSRILQAIAGRPLAPEQQALLDELVVRSAEPQPQPASGPPAAGPIVEPAAGPIVEPPLPPPPPLQATTNDDGWVQITVPLEIRVRVGAPTTATAAVAVEPGLATESVVIDPDFAGRRGFDSAFLGAGHDTPLPALSAAQQPLAAIDTTATSEPRELLRYHHYSVVLNTQRCLAFWVAVNIDGALHRRAELKRANDKWFYDPRIPQTDQIGEEMYVNNDLDRGHLVRRLDPAWGADLETAKKANDDTFHFTNCTPQHKEFNERKTLWAGLEDYVLNNADKENFKASVFTGPVLAPDDDLYRGVLLPRQFWKIAVMVKPGGTLSATAYLLSQASLIAGLESAEPFSYGAYKTFQVKVRDVEALTGLSFGALADADPLERLESTAGPAEVTSPESLVL